MTRTIDREKECPFLLRVFTRSGGHNPISSYTVDNVPKDELSLYTWQNATLEEIAQLIQQVVPDAQHEDARISFRLVYLDSQQVRFSYRELGRVVTSKPTSDHQKTLEECNLIIGDYLDVAVYIGPRPSLLRNSRDNSQRLPGGRFGGNRSGRGFGRDNNNFGRDNNRFGGRQRRDRF